LTVLKTRGSHHEQNVRAYEITSEGLTLEDLPPDDRR